jgi:hypothetical protein
VFTVIINLYLMEALEKVESSEPVSLAECSEVPFKVRERIRILVSILVEVAEVQDNTKSTVGLTDELRRGTEATASRFNDPFLATPLIADSSSNVRGRRTLRDKVIVPPGVTVNLGLTRAVALYPVRASTSAMRATSAGSVSYMGIEIRLLFTKRSTEGRL